jgi:hypothetical protein
MSILDENIAQNPNSDGSIGVTSEMKRNWMATSKWAMFFAILGFIYIGLSLLMIGSMGNVIQMMMIMAGDNPILAAMAPMMSYITVITAIMLVVMFFVNFFHFRFATQIQHAINFTDQSSFDKSWLNLRNYFRTYGIATIAVMVFYVIMLAVIGSTLATTLSPEE